MLNFKGYLWNYWKIGFLYNTELWDLRAHKCFWNGYQLPPSIISSFRLYLGNYLCHQQTMAWMQCMTKAHRWQAKMSHFKFHSKASQFLKKCSFIWNKGSVNIWNGCKISKVTCTSGLQIFDAVRLTKDIPYLALMRSGMSVVSILEMIRFTRF